MANPNQVCKECQKKYSLEINPNFKIFFKIFKGACCGYCGKKLTNDALHENQEGELK